MKLAKGNVKICIETRFGPNWPGQGCLAKTGRDTKCQRAAFKHNGRCAMHTADYLLEHALLRAYGASQRLILSMDVKQRTSWQPSAMLRWLGARLWVS